MTYLSAAVAHPNGFASRLKVIPVHKADGARGQRRLLTTHQVFTMEDTGEYKRKQLYF
jgi:hypothetical protein